MLFCAIFSMFFAILSFKQSKTTSNSAKPNYSSDYKIVSRETNHIVYQVYEDLSESPLCLFTLWSLIQYFYTLIAVIDDKNDCKQCFFGILITGNAIFKYILVVFSKFSSVFVFCRCFYRVLFKMLHVEHSLATHSVYFLFHVEHFCCYLYIFYVSRETFSFFREKGRVNTNIPYRSHYSVLFYAIPYYFA